MRPADFVRFGVGRHHRHGAAANLHGRRVILHLHFIALRLERRRLLGRKIGQHIIVIRSSKRNPLLRQLLALALVRIHDSSLVHGILLSQRDRQINPAGRQARNCLHYITARQAKSRPEAGRLRTTAAQSARHSVAAMYPSPPGRSLK
jgi:hypothetical protein